MAVQKAVDLVGEGISVEEAVEEALDRAGLTLEGITSFTVQQISGQVDAGRVVFRVELKVWFTLLERMHG
jgi:flavin-binding protein dodecin